MGFLSGKGYQGDRPGCQAGLSGKPNEADRAKSAQYAREQSEIEKEARAKQAEAKSNFHKHEIFARGVTMFQIAIAVAAISALTKQRRFWFVSMATGLIGCVFLLLALMAP